MRDSDYVKRYIIEGMEAIEKRHGHPWRCHERAGGEAVTLTDEAVYRMAMGFACWLNRRLTKERFTVAVGHDSRLSAGRIKKQVIAALTDAGFAVKDCGLSSTPAMFMTTVRLGCDAAVQITASIIHGSATA